MLIVVDLSYEVSFSVHDELGIGIRTFEYIQYL